MPPAEGERRSDLVRLSGTATTFTQGESYRQRAHELHSSRQLPGTVTVIRCTWVAMPELTVCLRQADPWRSGQAREATSGEIKAFADRALAWF